MAASILDEPELEDASSSTGSRTTRRIRSALETFEDWCDVELSAYALNSRQSVVAPRRPVACQR